MSSQFILRWKGQRLDPSEFLDDSVFNESSRSTGHHVGDDGARVVPRCEGITMRINGKVPGASMEIRPVRMHFSYDAEFGAYTPEAYERLLLDALAGDATLFLRRDEVEAAWAFIDPIREGWGDKPLTDNELYPAGSWGPTLADDLLARSRHAWREPQPLARTDATPRHHLP